MRLQLPRISKSSLAATIIAVLLTSGATGLIHAGANDAATATATPLPVAVVRFEQQSGYERRAQFVGTLRAANDSALGFEVGGTLKAVPGRAGLKVAKGDVLATLDADRRQAQLDTAAAELARVEAELELAVLRRERLADLEKRGLASTEAYDDARLTEKGLQASLRAVSARHQSALLEIEKSTLKAPFDGVIAERYVQAGTSINAGTPIVRLVSNDHYEAHIGIPVNHVSGLTIGEHYDLSARDRVFKATLRAVRADVDAATLTVGAVFDIVEPDTLYAGDSILLELTEQVQSKGGWLPIAALIEGDRGLWNVLVLTERDGQLVTVRETVEVIDSQADKAFVRGTLATGAEVVAAGVHRLSPGIPVARASGA